MVLCVDEKSQMQALDRSQPVPPMMPGMPERRSHDYARHGTTSLFAAFNIADGTVISELHRRHRAADYLVLVAAALTGNLIKAGVARPPTGTAGTGSLAGTVSFYDPNITHVGGHVAGYLAKLLVNVLVRSGHRYRRVPAPSPALRDRPRRPAPRTDRQCRVQRLHPRQPRRAARR